MLTKDNIDLPISEITPENYKVPAGEERFFHVKLEVPTFDQHNGKKLSHPFIQKFARVDFENGMLSLLRQQGYTVDILYDPKEWCEKHPFVKGPVPVIDKAKMRQELKDELRKELLEELNAEQKKENKNKNKGKKELKPAEGDSDTSLD